MYSARKPIIFHFNSWLSFQLCTMSSFYGDASVKRAFRTILSVTRVLNNVQTTVLRPLKVLNTSKFCCSRASRRPEFRELCPIFEGRAYDVAAAYQSSRMSCHCNAVFLFVGSEYCVVCVCLQLRFLDAGGGSIVRRCYTLLL